MVVEGVETVAQLELLKAWGSRIVQGFYFARPLPVPEVTALLRIGRITPVRTEVVEVATSGGGQEGMSRHGSVTLGLVGK